MRLCLLLGALALTAGPVAADDATPQDRPALEKKVGDLERRLAEVQKELREAREKMIATPVSARGAAEAYRRDPGTTVTVRVVVGGVAWLGWVPDDSHPGQVFLTAQEAASDGAFRIHVAPEAAALAAPPGKLEPPRPACKAGDDRTGTSKWFQGLKGKTIQVTGKVVFTPAGDAPTGGPANYAVTVGDAGEGLV